jgi:hypothetical protein
MLPCLCNESRRARRLDRPSAHLLLALLPACAPDPPSATTDLATTDLATTDLATTGADELPQAEVHFTLDLATTVETGALIGWNIGRGTLYAPEGDPLHPEWRTPAMQSAVAQLAELRAPGRAPQVRFSGLQIDGALGGDGYHFFRWVDPTRGVDPADNMASFEYFAVIDEIGATPLVTLNFGSGTAAEAAAYVAHLNGDDPADPNVAARRHWGRDAAYGVRRFEIGNEVYGLWNTGWAASGASYANPDAPGGGDPPWHGRPSADPHDYAARAGEYVDAVAAVDPAARFWVPLSQASMQAWGGPAAAVAALAPLLARDAVEAVVVHHYQLEDGVALGWDGADEPAFLVGGSEAFRPGYLALRAELAALPRPPALAITEYHVAGAFSKGQFERGDQAIVGLGVADLLICFAQLDVEVAAQHMALAFIPTDEPLFEPWYNPFRGDDAVAMPSYVVTRLFAEHLHPRRATLVPGSQVSWSMTVGDHAVAVPAVHAVAFVAGDGRAATLVALHRDLVGPRPLTLDLPPGWTVAAAREWAPPAVDHDAARSPVAVTDRDWRQSGDRVALTLAPHSVVALTFAAP